MIQMKFKKVIIATLLGGLTLFIWGGFSHLVLFIGTGFKPLPNEDKVMEVLKTNINEQGLYFFPGKDFKNSTKAQDAVFENKFRNGPVGMLIYRPIGGNPFAVSKLINQFLSNLLSVLIVVITVSSIYAGYWKRVIIISLLGLLTCTAVSSIYWNWYEFPTSFFVAQILDMFIGFFLAGLVICKVIPKPVIATNNI
ncbi:MAG: hypothetical protein V4613_02525 [Bacteroidota bacterium]